MRGRIPAIAAVTVLSLAAACTANTDQGDGNGGPAATDTATPTDTDARDDSADAGTSPPPTPSRPESSPTVAAPPTSASDPSNTATPTLDAKVPVGAFAPSVLRPDLSERVVIEVQADQAPRSGTVDHLVSTLAEVTGKPVDVLQGAAPGAGAREWDTASLRDAADRGAAVAQGDGVAVLRLLFVHGSLEGEDRALGVAVRGDVAAVFVDGVNRAAGVLGSAVAIERSVATHELGHLLGLVDLYLDTGREDPEHPGHSRNPDSVMYWAVESDLIGQVLGANPPDTFDRSDRADLEAIRNGA